MLTFSVVIPTYNRPTQLRQCLAALAAQNYPREAFEVIVVDDGGSKSLTEITDCFRSALHLQLLRQPNAGPASARNTGIKHAHGRYIALTDDDCVPAADWLQRLADSLSAAPDQLCGGQIINGLPQNVYSTASQAILEVVYQWQWDAKAPRFFTTNNLAFSTERFFQCGGLDPIFRVSEDREFCDRWTQTGGKLNYAPQAIIYHKHELSFGAFVRQHFNYGRGAYQFYLLRTTRGRSSLRVDPSFYLNLMSHSLQRPFREAVPVLGALLLSQVVNASGYMWERLFGRRRAASVSAPDVSRREQDGEIQPTSPNHS